MSSPIRFEELTVDAAADLAHVRGIIIFPVATTEAHGDHLPLCTDTITAEWIGLELSRRTGLPVLAPTPIRAGAHHTVHYDTEGDPIAGTIAISYQTLYHLMKDILRGLWAIGFRKIVFIQGHGQEPHFQVIAQEVTTELRREGKNLFIAAATYWELAAETLRREVTTPFFHAGEEETSNMLFARPELVQMDRVSGHELRPLLDKSLLKRSITQDETETFQIFDIAPVIPLSNHGEVHHAGIGTTEAILSASAEKGRKVMERAMQRYLDLIRDLEEYYAPKEVPGVEPRTRPIAKRFSVSY